MNFNLYKDGRNKMELHFEQPQKQVIGHSQRNPAGIELYKNRKMYMKQASFAFTELFING